MHLLFLFSISSYFDWQAFAFCLSMYKKLLPTQLLFFLALDFITACVYCQFYTGTIEMKITEFLQTPCLHILMLLNPPACLHFQPTLCSSTESFHLKCRPSCYWMCLYFHRWNHFFAYESVCVTRIFNKE